MGCLIFYIVVLFVSVYLALPVVLTRFVSTRIEDSRNFQLSSPPLVGFLMGLYCSLGATLAIKYLVFDENVLSYSYYSNLLWIIAPITGVIAGVSIQIGVRLKTWLEKVCFICGVLILWILACFATLLIIVPE